MTRAILGDDRPSLECLPPRALRFLASAFEVGANKYDGPMNWRVEGIVASEYYAKALRHLTAWFEGEDRTRDDGHHHLAAAAADILILIDAMLGGSLNDDRPTIANIVSRRGKR